MAEDSETRIDALTHDLVPLTLKVSIRIYAPGAVMPKQVLKRWGNSLAVRIPANIASELSLEEGQDVYVEVEDGRVIVRPHRAIRRFSRERLIQQYREGQLERHDEIDFGQAVGSEWGGPEDPSREGIE